MTETFVYAFVEGKHTYYVEASNVDQAFAKLRKAEQYDYMDNQLFEARTGHERFNVDDVDEVASKTVNFEL